MMTKKSINKRPEKGSGDENQPRSFELPQLRLVELTQEENKSLNRSIAETLEVLMRKKQGKSVRDLIETPVLDIRELESFRKSGLTKEDLVEMQNFIDDEVIKFVDSRRAQVIPLLGRIVISIVATKTAKKICKKIKC